MMMPSSILVVCLVLWANLGSIKAYREYHNYLSGTHDHKIYSIANGFHIDHTPQEINHDFEIDLDVKACVEKHFQEVEEQTPGKAEEFINNYLKQFLTCTVHARNEYFDKGAQEECDRTKTGTSCTQITSFDEQFKSNLNLAGYTHQVFLRDIQLTGGERVNLGVGDKDGASYDCKDEKLNPTTSTGNFSKSIAKTTTEEVTLDESSKVTLGNGIDVDVSISGGFFGIIDIGTTYSGRYMNINSATTGSSEKTTKALMKQFDMSLQWTQNPGSVYKTEHYKRYINGKRKFTAWIEVRGWLANFATLSKDTGNYDMHYSNRTALTLVPVGKFADYHGEQLKAQRLNAHSFMFPVEGHLDNDVTEYYFQVKQTDNCYTK